KEEKLYLVKAMLLIVGIYVFQDFIYDSLKLFAFFLPIIFILYLWFKSIQSGDHFRDLLKEQITLMPIPYAEGGKKLFIPKATILLVLTNILVFYFFMELSTLTDFEFMLANFSFLPDKITWWNILVSPITSMFIHSHWGHLWGNMAFLWAFGPAVEERLGVKKFILLYLVTGILGKLTAAYIHFNLLDKIYHGLGASGAIAGIMGVFMVRCYFKKLVIPIPLFGLISFKLRINSLLPLGFFFLRDFQGGVDRLAGINRGIGYWVHVGSMVAGMLIAARLKLHRAAAEESYTEAGIRAIDRPVYGESGEKQLFNAMAINPKNEAALLGLARIKASSRRPEGREYFQEAINLALGSDPKRAVEMYNEYLQAYNRMLEPGLQYRLARIFHSQGNFEGAARSLEMIVAEPTANDATREQAFSQLIAILAEKGLIESAQFRCRQFGEAFPHSTLLKRAQEISSKDSGRTVKM
ncbi:MAG: rhomboid family intramembrane serine protease, partial [Candidatus Aminicenantes bacterium]|nr:rhomboid family intramembrane serine protease [Candidatus Aminicenantes bacterium]